METTNKYNHYKVKPGASAAASDNTILSQWISGRLSTSDAIKKIERNNESHFDNEEHFLNWTKAHGWRKSKYM